MRRLVVVALLAGCGRLSFDPQSAPSTDAGGDAPIVHTGRPNVIVLGVRGANPSTMWDALVSANAQNRSSITGSSTIDDGALATADVVILLDPQKQYSAAESAAIANVVARGGGLLAVTGFQNGSDQARFNAAMTTFGVQANAMTTFSGQVMDLPAHPITTGVATLPYSGGYEIASTTAAAPVLGRANGTVVGCAFAYQAGRVMVWGDDFVTYDLDWDSRVATFWDNAFAWVWPTQ